MTNEEKQVSIDDSTKVALKLVMWGAGIMLAIMSPALGLAIKASIQVGAVTENLKTLTLSSARTEHNTAATATALQALDKRYEGDTARMDGRMSAAERALIEHATRIRELEQGQK